MGGEPLNFRDVFLYSKGLEGMVICMVCYVSKSCLLSAKKLQLFLAFPVSLWLNFDLHDCFNLFKKCYNYCLI